MMLGSVADTPIETTVNYLYFWLLFKFKGGDVSEKKSVVNLTVTFT